MNLPILSLITFLPLFGVIILLCIPREKYTAIKLTAFLVSVVTFLVSLPLFFYFRIDTPEMQFVERYPWIEAIGASYHLGIDGISLFLVLLTTFLSASSILSSWTAITEKVKGYYACLLLLETGMLGVFVSLDLLLFYLFWEAMLIPMYFLIGIWGGPRKIYATIKFVLYTMFGSVLMLVAILYLAYHFHSLTGYYTLDLLKLYEYGLRMNVQIWLFLAFALAFAIKVPMFPFHTWLPDAHVEAPTAGSVILAGVLLKMGTYGFLRFCLPLFPQASMLFMPMIILLAVFGIIYGALVSMVQPDIKKLVAYSSVSHLGYVMLGIFVFNMQGISGGILQMVNHGLSTGALFLLVGMIYERRHTRLISDYGGLAKVMPVYFAFFLVITLSSIGLPGLNGFVGEFTILVGAFKFSPWITAIASLGVVLSAVYMLWMFQRVFFGQVTHDENKTLLDLSKREIAVLVPIII
ncbi:MAG: NADH-quinone oxidoreductase subunit M, partial [bacterium]|nr:NADH-quinone oxidoreductase subunit M [bacterium]